MLYTPHHPSPNILLVWWFAGREISYLYPWFCQCFCCPASASATTLAPTLRLKICSHHSSISLGIHICGGWWGRCLATKLHSAAAIKRSNCKLSDWTSLNNSYMTLNVNGARSFITCVRLSGMLIVIHIILEQAPLFKNMYSTVSGYEQDGYSVLYIVYSIVY